MRFGLIHRIMTDALAALGLLALVSSGELNRWIAGSIVIGLVLALAVPERWQDKTWLRQFGVVAPIGLLVVQITRLVFGSSVLALAVEFAAALQVVRLGTRRGAAHDQQVIVLALLHLIAGTVLGGGLAYGLCFLGFLVVAPGALVLSHLRREVEGNYRQGARPNGLPVDATHPRKPARDRRCSGVHVPVGADLCLPRCLVLFPRVGLSLPCSITRPGGGRLLRHRSGGGRFRHPTIACTSTRSSGHAVTTARAYLRDRIRSIQRTVGRAATRARRQKVAAVRCASRDRPTRRATRSCGRSEPMIRRNFRRRTRCRLLSRGTPLLGGRPP
jgi:hypothetical protein